MRNDAVAEHVFFWGGVNATPDARRAAYACVVRAAGHTSPAEFPRDRGLRATEDLRDALLSTARSVERGELCARLGCEVQVGHQRCRGKSFWEALLPYPLRCPSLDSAPQMTTQERTIDYSDNNL
jgi:hypothetical protein